MCAFRILLRRSRQQRRPPTSPPLAASRFSPISNDRKIRKREILLRHSQCVRFPLRLLLAHMQSSTQTSATLVCVSIQHMQSVVGVELTRPEWRIANENHVDLCVSANRIFRTRACESYSASDSMSESIVDSFRCDGKFITNTLNWLAVCARALTTTSTLDSFTRCSLLAWIYLLFIYTFTRNDSEREIGTPSGCRESKSLGKLCHLIFDD